MFDKEQKKIRSFEEIRLAWIDFGSALATITTTQELVTHQSSRSFINTTYQDVIQLLIFKGFQTVHEQEIEQHL
jgi:hypothetical protein